MEPGGKAASNVRLIFQLVQQGYTAGEIVQALFERGVLTPAEYKAVHGFHVHDISRCRHIWQKATVLRILGTSATPASIIIGKREVTEAGGNRVRMKDESQWVKNPDHHPAIVSRKGFEQVRAKLPHFKCSARSTHSYLLREKMFCGCCRHAMVRTGKNPAFICRYTRVDKKAPCHGLRISKMELENTLYEILSKQARIILNAEDLSSAGKLDVQLAQEAESSRKVEATLEQKRELYERLVLGEIAVEEYKTEKAALDDESNRLKQLHDAIATQTKRMQMSEKTKRARTTLAQKVTEAI